VSENQKLALGIAAAFVTALGSLVVALLNGRATRRAQAEAQKHERALARLEASFREQEAEGDARRDYEYKARLRLYEEYEPLLFRLMEVAENGLYRIHSLARSSRLGDLTPAEGWLSHRGYYLSSTMYRLFAPLAIFELIQRKLTLVDLNVDPLINNQYLLAKQLAIIFTDDFDFARFEPEIPYEPLVDNWRTMRARQPQRYWRQGIPVGSVDRAIEALVVSDNEIPRCVSFGEFDDAYQNAKTKTGQIFGHIDDVLIDFHPSTRPVLWRALVTQAHLYRTILRLRDVKLSGVDEIVEPWAPMASDERTLLDWRRTPDEAPDEDVLVVPFLVAETYLRGRLEPRLR
jgi:hypothetical protein